MAYVRFMFMLMLTNYFQAKRINFIKSKNKLFYVAIKELASKQIYTKTTKNQNLQQRNYRNTIMKHLKIFKNSVASGKNSDKLNDLSCCLQGYDIFWQSCRWVETSVPSYKTTRDGIIQNNSLQALHVTYCILHITQYTLPITHYILNNTQYTASHNNVHIAAKEILLLKI